MAKYPPSPEDLNPGKFEAAKQQAQERAEDVRKRKQRDLCGLMESASFRRVVRGMLDENRYFWSGINCGDSGDLREWVGQRRAVGSLLDSITNALGQNALLKLLETEEEDERIG